MFRRVFATALGAGIGVGLLLAALQHVALVPMILEAEKYERKEEPKKQATNPADQRETGHAVAGAKSALVLIGHAHAHGHDAAASDDSPWRAVWTTVATTLTSVGFALLLVGAFAVSGREVTARDGVLWGLPDSRPSRWRRLSACHRNCRARSPPISGRASSGGSARWQ